MTRRRGTVLGAVLVVVTMAAMVVATLLFRMRAEMTGSGGAARGQQAYAAAMSGLHAAVALVELQRDDPLAWYDAPEIFREQLVFEEGGDRWYFTVYAADPFNPEVPRFGLTDETSKINLNAADVETLARLPGMTRELADSLADYVDYDSIVRPGGAEQDFYNRLPQPYFIRNDWLSTLEELLMVRGFTAPLVFGEDANFNYRLDPNERDGDETFPPDDGDGTLDVGFQGVATVWGYEPNVDSRGKRRVFINYTRIRFTGAEIAMDDPSDQLRAAGMSEETVKFIDAYRRDGKQFKHASELLDMQYTTRVSRKGVPAGTQLESGVNSSNLRRVLDRLSANGLRRTAGRVNVNTAPVGVLAALPEFDEGLAQQIVDMRSSLDRYTLSSLAWLVEHDVVDAERFKKIAPYLTTRSYQFRVRSIGYGRPSGRYRILEGIVDVGRLPARVIYLRELTQLGLPFSLEDPEGDGR